MAIQNRFFNGVDGKNHVPNGIAILEELTIFESPCERALIRTLTNS